MTISSTLKIWKKETAAVEKMQTASFVLERIIAEARTSQGISTSSTPQRLILNFPDGDIIWDYVNQKVRRIKGSSGYYITIENQIENITFAYPAPGAVNITLKLDSKFFLTGEVNVQN